MAFIKFKIEGMKCNGCAKSIEDAIKILEGIKNMEVDFESKIATVDYDDNKISENDIFEVVESKNYKIIK